MTMLDDDVLASLFARAGASFEVPESGPADILARAAGPARVVVTPEPDDAGDAVDAVPEPNGTGDGDGAAPSVSLAEARTGRSRRVLATARRHRLLSVAAGIVVVLFVAGTIGALVQSTSGPNLTSALSKAPAPARAPHAAAPASGTGTGASGTAGPARVSPGSELGLAPSSSNGTANGSPSSGSGPAVTVPTTPPSLPSGAVGQPAKIEQTGTLGLTVRHDDVGRTVTRLNALAGAYGGFVANSQTQSGSGSGGAPYGTVTLQVPVDSFSAVLKQAQSLGKTSNLNTKATDVTSQYVDLQARISALDDSRQQYLTILSKATSIGDVLSVQEQVDTIQSQIEQLQGQLNVLTAETSYSTLTVNVNEGAAPPPPVPLPESGLVRAWHDSVGGFVTGVEGVVRVAGPILFALLLLGIALVGGRVLWRRYQRHRL